MIIRIHTLMLFLLQAKIKQKIREIEENQKRIEKLEDYITTSRYFQTKPFGSAVFSLFFYNVFFWYTKSFIIISFLFSLQTVAR